MDRVTVKSIRLLLEDTLDEYFKMEGISVEVGNASYGQSECTFKVIFVDGEGTSKAESDWEQYAELYGLKKSWLGKSFKLSGKPFTITGFKPKARKNQVLIRNEKGKGYVCSADMVVNAFKK